MDANKKEQSEKKGEIQCHKRKRESVRTLPRSMSISSGRVRVFSTQLLEPIAWGVLGGTGNCCVAVRKRTEGSTTSLPF